MKKLFAAVLCICMFLSIGISSSANASLPLSNDSRSSNYTLQDSTLYDWNQEMSNYNCYSFAIGIYDQAYDPGDFSNNDLDMWENITNIAQIVKEDLESNSLGYDCVSMGSDCPTTLGIWDNAIAVRKTTYGIMDYHFAKLTDDGWLHKPGRSAVLKFNSPPSHYEPWTNEAFDGTEYYAPNITYNSTIIFLLYKQSHSDYDTSVWTGNHYHSVNKHYYEYQRYCTDCECYYLVWTSLPCNGNCIMPWGETTQPEIS